MNSIQENVLLLAHQFSSILQGSLEQYYCRFGIELCQHYYGEGAAPKNVPCSRDEVNTSSGTFTEQDKIEYLFQDYT